MFNFAIGSISREKNIITVYNLKKNYLATGELYFTNYFLFGLIDLGNINPQKIQSINQTYAEK